MGMASDIITPSAHPLMTTMYYVPDYTNQDYMQAEDYGQSGNFVQTDQSYIQQNEVSW